jgi:hypothetical protein
VTLPTPDLRRAGLLLGLLSLTVGLTAPAGAAEPPEGGGIPPDIAAELARIEADHRDILALPVERWGFGAVKARYRALLDRVSDPETQAAIRARLDLVARHEEIARTARTFQSLLERSRRRDLAVERVKRKLASQERPERRAFVAQGLIQPSSREVDGHRVYALIGPDGNPVAYLDVPPGLDARRVATRRVGVRGSVHYNEALGSRLIAVRDLEPLE